MHRVKDRRVLNHLRRYARARGNDRATHNHAACAFRNGRIVAMARNLSAMPISDRTDRKRWVREAHAEIRVIKQVVAPYRLDLLVIRINRRGDLVLSKPCPICQAAVSNVGFRRVLWSDARGGISAL